MKKTTLMNRTKVFLFLFLTLAMTHVNAQGLTEQQKQTKRDSIINNSDFIFKGGSSAPLLNFIDDNKNVYSVRQVYVTEVLRGPQELVNTYVYLAYDAPCMIFNENSNYNKFQKKQRCASPLYWEPVDAGYYFGKISTISQKYYTDTKYTDPNSASLNFENSFIFEPTSSLVFGIGENTLNPKEGSSGTFYGLYDMDFENKEAVQTFLKAYPNITIPEGNKTTPSMESGSTRTLTPEEIEEDRIWMQGGVDRMRIKKKRFKSDGAVVDVIYTAEKQKIEYVGGKYIYSFELHFEYASSDLTTVYPDNVLMYFQYNKGAFGANINANGKLNCYPNTNLFNTTDYTFDYRDATDKDNAAKILLSAEYTMIGDIDNDPEFVANRTPLTVGEQYLLCDVEIEFDPANLGNGVGLRNLLNDMEWNMNFWTEDPNCFSCFETANETFFNLNNSYKLGAVHISDVQASNGGDITGGTDCWVTITGSGFMKGDSKLSAFANPPAIFMRNADGRLIDQPDGTQKEVFEYVPIDWTDIDIANWTDNEIRFRVPSFVVGSSPNSSVSVGSGFVKVRNQVNQEAISPSAIDVKYSIMNNISGWVPNHSLGTWGYDTKKIPYWSRLNCKEQIRFKFDYNIPSLKKKKLTEVFEAAFEEWNNALGFPFLGFERNSDGEVVQTASHIGSLDDDQNIIYFEDADALAAVPTPVITGTGTGAFLEACGSDVSRTQIDFYIVPSTMSIAKDRLRHVIIHELGHGLGLGHVIDPAGTMHPYIQATPPSSITPNAVEGLAYLFNESKNKTWSASCTTLKPLFSTNTTCVLEAPADFKATATSSTEIHLEWLADLKATGYKIQWSPNEDMTGATTINVSSKTTDNYTLSGLSSFTKYYFRIKAIHTNTSLNSVYSYITEERTKMQLFGLAPSSTDASSASEDAVLVAWDDAATDETAYVVERTDVTGLKSTSSFEIIAIVDADVTEFLDLDVVQGRSYEYRIKYLTEDGVSSYSAPVVVTPGVHKNHSIALPVSRNALLYNNTHPDYTSSPDNNYNAHSLLRAWRWTHGGHPTYMRSLLDFDLSSIPADAIIVEATLELFGTNHVTNLTTGSSTYKSNASWLEIVTEAWEETQVTWNTQPASSTTYRVDLANSSTSTQNYTVDITDLIAKMVADPSNTHGLMFRLKNETPYTRMQFASPTYSDQSLKPILRVSYVSVPEQTLVMNPKKDALIFKSTSQVDGENSFYGDYPRIMSSTWTNGTLYWRRSLIDFELDAIPSNAVVTDARLSLYSCAPQTSPIDKHYSTLSTGSSIYKSNASYLKKVIEPWSEHKVTWNNQPAVSDEDKVLLEQSATYSQDYLNIDITNIAQDIVSDPENNHGVMLMLQNEQKYARMSFASSDHENVDLHPDLEVKYKVYPTNLKLENRVQDLPFNSKTYISVDSKPVLTDSVGTYSFTTMPNPTNNRCTVSLNSENDKITNITISSANGIILMTSTPSETDNKVYTIDLSEYAKGTYQVRVETESGETFTKQIIKF